MLNMETVGINLKRLRMERNLSFSDVAKIIGITRQAYNNYELTKKQISLNSLLILSNFYGVSIDEIVGNTITAGRPKAVDFITYEIVDDEINETNKIIISSETDDNFIVKDPQKNMIYVFGTSSTHIPNTVMLFTLNNKTYMSEIIEVDNHYIYYDHELKPNLLSKKEYKDIVHIGTLLLEIKPKYDYFISNN